MIGREISAKAQGFAAKKSAALVRANKLRRERAEAVTTSSKNIRFNSADFVERVVSKEEQKQDLQVRVESFGYAERIRIRPAHNDDDTKNTSLCFNNK